MWDIIQGLPNRTSSVKYINLQYDLRNFLMLRDFTAEEMISLS